MQLAPASWVAPIDKLSLPITIIISVVFLSEALTWRVALGLCHWKHAHAGEEDLIVKAHQRVRFSHPTALLILVPHHLHRTSQVENWLNRESVQFIRCSEEVGPHHSIDAAAAKTLMERGGAQIVQSAPELASKIVQLLADTPERARIGRFACLAV